MYLWEDFNHTLECEHLGSWPARKSQSSYCFSLVAFAMGWEALSGSMTRSLMKAKRHVKCIVPASNRGMDERAVLAACKHGE